MVRCADRVVPSVVSAFIRVGMVLSATSIGVCSCSPGGGAPATHRCADRVVSSVVRASCSTSLPSLVSYEGRVAFKKAVESNDTVTGNEVVKYAILSTKS